MKLNLGAGDKHIDGFVNIDMNRECKPDVVGDVSNLDNTFQWRKSDSIIYEGSLRGLFDKEPITEIVAYDIIEHFDRFQHAAVLKNWFDHLAPGGVLYIRTNDLDRMIKLYHTEPVAFPAPLFIWHLMCEHEKPGMGHKWCFTKETLYHALLTAGFKKIRVTPEADILTGNYPHSFTTIDRCNMHMTAEKV